MSPPWARPLTHRRGVYRYLLMQFFVVTFLFPFSASAQLVWSEQKIEQEATAFDIDRVFTYTFSNDGDYPVTITSLTSSCGCTTAALTQDRYAPGESGVIEATFDIGDRRGSQSKTLTVRTDDPRNPVNTLIVNLEIAEVIELQPRLLLWRKGEARSPKTVKVIVHRPDLLELEGVEPQAHPEGQDTANRKFTLTWQPPEPPREPPETSESPITPETAASSVKPDASDGSASKSDARKTDDAVRVATNSDQEQNPPAAADGPSPPTPDLPVIYTVLVEPPPQGRSHKAVFVLKPKQSLPEGVTLPRLVARTLGSPPATPHPPSDGP